MAKELKDMTKAELLEHIETITNESELAKTNATLVEENEQLKAANEELTGINETLNKDIADAMDQIDNLDKASNIAEPNVISIGKELYEVITPNFYHDGKLCSIADLKKDKDVQKAAIAAGNVKLKQ